MRSKNAIRSLVDLFLEDIWNAGKLSLINDLFAPDFIFHAEDTVLKGKEHFCEFVRSWLTAFPDLKWQIQEVLHDSQKVTIRGRCTGTHLGVFQGILPTRRSIDITGTFICSVKNRKFIESWLNVDMFKLMKTLKIFSSKQHTESDFCEDFSGSAVKIYQWLMKARPTPSCKHKLIYALRDQFSTVPKDNYPSETNSSELLDYVDMSEVLIPGGAGSIRTHVFRPKSVNKRLPVLIYFHGGGWSVNCLELATPIARKLAYLSEAVVVSVDYRLAPEHPFPSGLEDCEIVYHWIRNQAANEVGIDPGRVAVGGDGAGGNLALALALRVRDHKGVMPDGVLALCPSTDLIAEKYRSMYDYGDRGLIYDYSTYSYVRSIYAPYEKWTHPYVSPMYGDFQRFCPTCIIAGGKDPIIDDNKAFAKKLQEAGNQDVEFYIHEEMPHGFYYYLGLTKEEDIAYQQMTKFLKRVLC